MLRHTSIHTNDIIIRYISLITVQINYIVQSTKIKFMQGPKSVTSAKSKCEVVENIGAVYHWCSLPCNSFWILLNFAFIF